ncbi:MAG: 4-hydroxy-tetrahydrodipicolinate synthase [Neomegalonema sp.]|nr:4-hydroxy-tetrahydrodipicolinate synthase [Neomegalonema sp.]
MFKGSLPALVTPFKDGQIDSDALAALVERQVVEGASGIVAVGTTGESPTLSHEEHERVVTETVAAAKGRVPVIAGAGSNNTVEAVRLAEHAASTGADAILSVVPYYNKPSQQGLYAHFKAIHDAAEIPVILYNVPGRTIAELGVETTLKLAELPRIVGIKDASNDLTRPLQMAEAAAEGFALLSGEDGTALAYNAHGGVGCISVTANVAPKLFAKMQAATLAGDYVEARRLQVQMTPLHTALFLEPNPAPTKYALSLLGLCQEDVRSPLLPVSEPTRAAVREAMALAELL